jgi:hypothetical protein
MDSRAADLSKPKFNAELLELEKSFDPRHLTEQQTKYLVGLQSIYNELNDAKLNLFKSNNNTPTEENKQNFMEIKQDEGTNEIVIKVPKPSHDPSDHQIVKVIKKLLLLFRGLKK